MELDAYFDDPTRRDWQTSEPDPVRLALVGLGNFARNEVLPAMAGTDFCTVTALVSGSPEKAAATADEYGVDVTMDYGAFADGEAADAYDAVYVAGPNAHHLDHVRAAAENGKGVLCEKPLESTADRAREAVRVCEEAGVTLMVAYRPQLDPVLRRLRELVRDGGLGDPVQFHGWFTGHILAGGDEDQWRLDPEVAGGGALLDVGVYPLNAVRFLLDADPVAVQATTNTTDEAFEGVDQHVAFQLEFPDAVTASCSASYDAQADDRFHLIGTEGRVEMCPAFDSTVDPTLSFEFGDERVEYTAPYVDEIAEEFDYFAHCVRTGERPEPDGRDGAVDLDVAAAVYESADTGRRVEF
jgi:xylose dehydrogenase (NAD/NADP)